MRLFLQKLLEMGVTLLLVVTLTFFLMKAIPGDPFTDEQALLPEIHQALLKHYGLSDPWPEQYLRYLKALVHGDLGPSFRYAGRSVNTIIAQGFSVSATLGLAALALALTSGISIGVFTAFRKDQWPDIAFKIFTALALSIPSFLIAALLQYTFALRLGLFPVARWGSFMQAILPTIALAALPAAFISRLVRASMLETLHQNFIKTAISKGLSKTAILFRHILPATLAPLLSYFGQLAANILVGSFIIEKIFGIPGLGQWFVSSVNNRDYTVIMGITVFYSIILITCLFIAECLASWLDPRLREKAA